MPSFKGAWNALVQFQAAVKEAVPDALLHIEETESRLGISLVFPSQTGEATSPATTMPAAAARTRGRPPASGSMLTEESLAALIDRRPGINRSQILAEVQKSQPAANAGTVGTRLSAMVKRGRIRQEGDGYRVVEGSEAARAA